MVTYISSANADKYNLLFDKASKMLIEKPPADRPDSFSEDFAITTLNEYFAYLEDLVKISDQEDISRFFVRLPLDEDFFEIDANSRTIKVPNSSFGRYGVGVQGDELAEVVYFTIDRFFDSTDLASNDINIVIQWEVRNEKRELVAGISQHFGKDIETIPGKIIFGWPISHELTEAAGTIRFAVRFYQTGSGDSEEVRQLVYSFSTLPAEVTINASLNYDLINHSVKEIDHGKTITSRIKNNGIYDAGAPIPSEPIITIPLYVVSPEGNELVKIVDLPVGENSVVKLAVSARNADIGAISYDWRKFAYDPTTGSYEKDPTGESLPAQIEYEEADPAEELSDIQEYYIVQFDADHKVVTASLMSRDRIANLEIGSKTITIENEDEETETISVPVFMENGAEIHLYKKMSVASVDTVGEYAVDIRARTSANSVMRYMRSDERIRIPGPLKPVISLPEESEGISVTTEDGKVHAIADNGTVTLIVPAVPGEEDRPAEEVGENPQVVLNYQWKQVSNGVATDVIAVAPIMPVSVLPASQLPDDEAWLEEASENGALGAKGIFNQEHVSVIQNGTSVTIYPDTELKSFWSTDENQRDTEHQWLALDIDTGLETLEGVVWNDSYTFTAADENELGVANGHILFWVKVDEILDSPAIFRKINDTTLTFVARSSAPANITYDIRDNEITIIGLPEEGLDNSYFCEVTATRNKRSTTATSGDYRVTNSPEAPVLSMSSGDPIEERLYNITKQDFTGVYKKLSFKIEEPSLSDGVIYLWMHGVLDNREDSDDYGDIKIQIDLDGALAAILGNTEFPGEKDIICDPDVAHYENGEIVFGDSVGSREYQLGPTDSGIYYCIVINELNNNKAASVGPFFFVS